MISSMPKKAVHVKWAGKTIALGTFPIAEADEKCARAKALTRAWRSTIRPKPSREWVISELERLNVRVVTGRSPRDDEYENNNDGRLPTAASTIGGMNDNNSNILGGYHHPSLLGNIVDPNFVGRRGSVTASLLNPADVARVNGGGGGPPSAWPRGQGQAMNGFGFDPSSMMPPHQTRTSSLSGSSIVSGSANEITAPKEGGGTSTAATAGGAPPYRPLVGGGSAAAYEAARAEHYRQLASNKDTQGDGSREQAAKSFNGSIPTSTSSAVSQSQGILPPHSMESVSRNFGAPPGSTMNGSQGRIGGLSLLASQHYEMLKLHHMNLLNEIQETTLMMNIYQQQLQQQQQQQLEMQQQQPQQQQQAQEQPQLQPQQQQKYDRDDHDSHYIPHNQGVVSPTQQVMNNFGGNQYTNELPKNLPQSKQEDRTNMVGSEHSENNNIDKSEDMGIENTSLDNDPTIAKHNVGKDKISREDKLATIKAEIEERKRMLEELSKSVDEQEQETFKKPKMSQV